MSVQRGHKPSFEIVAQPPGTTAVAPRGGRDISALIADRLVSLTVTDEAGQTADRLDIELDDRGGRLDLPEPGLVLDVRLGASPALLTPVGRFCVGSVGVSGPQRRMSVEAHAADLGAAIRAPRTRSFTDTSLGDLVTVIAGAHGLKAACAEALAAHRWPHLAQNGESDLNLLTRLAGGLDATAKASDGVLVVAQRAAATNAAGEALPLVAVSTGDVTGWSWRRTERDTYGTVTARWRDVAAGRTETVSAGTGAPERTLRRVFGTEAEARRAAEAALEEAGRGESLELTLAGFGAGCFAGGRIDVSGLRAGVDGAWNLTRVEHRLGAALVTSLKAERGTTA